MGDILQSLLTLSSHACRRPHLKGTNCYLIQSPNNTRSLYLIDTGSGRPYSQSFVSLLINEIKRLGGSSSLNIPIVTDILLTHRHQDHIGGLPDVLVALAAAGNQPPRIHKWKYTIEDNDKQDFDAELVASLPEGLFERTKDGEDLHMFKEGQTFVLGGSEVESGDKTTLSIMHTPGHTNDSISLVLEEEQAIFTGDTVLG
jgi:endoribonuclease LACTB2